MADTNPTTTEPTEEHKHEKQSHWTNFKTNHPLGSRVAGFTAAALAVVGAWTVAKNVKGDKPTEPKPVEPVGEFESHPETPMVTES